MHFSVLDVREKKHLSKSLQSCIIHHYATGIQFNQYSLTWPSASHSAVPSHLILFHVVQHSQRCLPHMVCMATPWLYTLLVVDGQDGHHGQKGQPCSCNISIFHNPCKLQLLKITAHAFIHQTCMAISCWSLSSIKLFHRRQPQVISHGYFFTHLFKLLESFLTKLMHNISSKYVIPRDHIWWWHLLEHLKILLLWCCRPEIAIRHMHNNHKKPWQLLLLVMEHT